MKVCKEAQICLICISPKVNFTFARLTDCPVMKAIQRDGKKQFNCQLNGCQDSIWTCVRHKDELINIPFIQKRRDQMTQRGWTMGMVTIMGTIPTSPQNTGSPTKPITNTHKVNNGGTGMKAVKVDSSGPWLMGTSKLSPATP
jgi:hypothetical protein